MIKFLEIVIKTEEARLDSAVFKVQLTVLFKIQTTNMFLLKFSHELSGCYDR